MYRFVIRKNYLNMLVGLANKKEPQSIDNLRKEADVNYYHLTSVLRQFHGEGLINRDEKKNVIDISLTDKGLRIADHLRKIDEIMQEKPVKEKPVKDPKKEEKKDVKEDKKEVPKEEN